MGVARTVPRVFQMSKGHRDFMSRASLRPLASDLRVVALGRRETTAGAERGAGQWSSSALPGAGVVKVHQHPALLCLSSHLRRLPGDEDKFRLSKPRPFLRPPVFSRVSLKPEQAYSRQRVSTAGKTIHQLLAPGPNPSDRTSSSCPSPPCPQSAFTAPAATTRLVR